MIWNKKYFGVSIDFWNTLYGNGDEPERHKRRVEYFHSVISEFINICIGWR